MRAELLPVVRRFILTSVPSVPFMEAMLLMRSAPAATWTPASLASRLYLPERQAAELLRNLAAAAIAREMHAGSYTYAPGEELRELLDNVANAYASHLVEVTSLIHSRTDKRAQQFADAFRLRKEN